MVVLKRFDGNATERDLIKRVIGMPGDTIQLTNLATGEQAQATINARGWARVGIAADALDPIEKLKLTSDKSKRGKKKPMDQARLAQLLSADAASAAASRAARAAGSSCAFALRSASLAFVSASTRCACCCAATLAASTTLVLQADGPAAVALLLSKAPPLLMPVPRSVRAPVLVIIWPLRSSAPVLLTKIAPVPKAVALPACSTPALTVVPAL